MVAFVGRMVCWLFKKVWKISKQETIGPSSLCALSRKVGHGEILQKKKFCTLNFASEVTFNFRNFFHGGLSQKNNIWGGKQIGGPPLGGKF